MKSQIFMFNSTPNKSMRPHTLPNPIGITPNKDRLKSQFEILAIGVSEGIQKQRLMG